MVTLEFNEQEEKTINALVNIDLRIKAGEATERDYRAWEIMAHHITRRIIAKSTNLPWNEK